MRRNNLGALLVLALTASLVITPTSSALAGPATGATFIDYAQCSNGAPPSTSLACPGGWINGILQQSNSHYAEDEVTPQRLSVQVPKGSPATGRTITLRYQTRKGTIHAYDSLATWNLTQTQADRCQGLTAANCVGGTPTTFPIPDDPTAVTPSGSGISAVTTGHMIPSGPGRVLTMYGGTITGMTVPVHDNPTGSGDDYATTTITYRVANTTVARKVQLLFGGHISATSGPRGWGTGLGAGNIAGGPYHIKFTAADGASIGNRDNQIMGAAIAGSPTLEVTKTPDAATVNAGDQIGFTIVVKNTGTGTATNVTLEDPLPAGTGIDWSINPANAACSITGSPPTETLNCSFGDLAAGASTPSVHIVSATTSGTSGTFTNTATARSDNTPPATGSAQVTVNAPKLVPEKTPDDANVDSGDAIGFTITITNTGSGTAKNVTVSDLLPGGDEMGTDWTISPAVTGCVIDGSSPSETLNCSFGDLAPGASASVHISSPTSSSFTGTIENTAVAKADNHPPVEDPGTITVDPPDLVVDKTPDAGTVSAGDTIGFTITVTNNGPGVAKNVTLSDPLPAGTGIDWSISPDNAACSISGTPPNEVLECSFGDLDPDGTASVHITSATTAETTGTFVNTATAKADNHPAVEGTGTITVNQPDLDPTKTPDNATVSGGGSIGFTISITNNGAGVARNVTVSDPLPGGVGIDWSIDPANDACSIAGSPTSETLECSWSAVDPGQTVSVHVVSGTTTSSCGTYPNTATIDADNITAPIEATATVTVVCADLSLVKAADKTEVKPGGTITYTLTYANNGDGDAQDVVITETIPTGTTFESCSDDCSHNGTVTWNLGTVPAGEGGSVTLTVLVTSNEVCEICNVATISSPSQGGEPRSSNTVCVENVPTPTPAGANASGSAFGAHVEVPLLDVDQTITPVSSSQSGPGVATQDDVLLEVDVLPESGEYVSADVMRTASTSTVSSTPAESHNLSTSEVLGVNVLNGLVTADVVRGVASATATGDASSVSSVGSTFKNLVVNGDAISSDVPYNHRIDLPAELFGAESHVILYERIAATSGPSAGELSDGTYTADVTVRMITVHVTDALVLVPGDQPVDVVVSEAVAHADFPQTRVCSASGPRSVSGHAFILSETTDPAILPTLVGYASIPASGGYDYKTLNDLATPVATASTWSSESSGIVGAASSTASSYADVETVCVLPEAGECLIGATALRSQSNSTATSGAASSTTTGSEFLNIQVGDLSVGDNPEPNTVIELPGIGFVVLNEQEPDAAAPGHTGMTVRAIHIVITVPENPTGLQPGVEIIVSEAHSDALWVS